MIKYAVATHGDMAEGLKSTIDLFLPNKNVSYFSAYTSEGSDIETSLREFVEEVKDNSAIIFTDILGGSVNQKAVLATSGKDNIYVIAGFNLPLVIDLLTKENINKTIVENSIKQSKEAIILSNDLKNIVKDDDEFFE